MYQNRSHQFVGRKGGKGLFWMDRVEAFDIGSTQGIPYNQEKGIRGGRLVILNNTFITVKLV